MGDWSYTTLTVLIEDKGRTVAILGDDGEDVQDPDDSVFVTFGFESNYCRLSYHDKLVAAGIPYIFSWSGSGEHAEGTSYSRYTETGKHTLLELWYRDENPSMSEIFLLIDKPEELRAYILKHKADTTSLPWDNQLEYAKLFRAQQLIAPKDAAP